MPKGFRPDDYQVIGDSETVMVFVVEGIRFGHSVCQFAVIRPVPRFGEVVLVVELILLQVREKEDAPAMHRAPFRIGEIGGRIATVLVVVVGNRQRELLEVSEIGGARGANPNFLDPEYE